MSSIRIQAKTEGDMVTVRAMINHTMETGRRKLPDGSIIPAHYIREVRAMTNGRVVFDADWGPGISRNPLLIFRYRGGKAGDALTLSWIDSEGESDHIETRVG